MELVDDELLYHDSKIHKKTNILSFKEIPILANKTPILNNSSKISK